MVHRRKPIKKKFVIGVVLNHIKLRLHGVGFGSKHPVQAREMMKILLEKS